MAADEFCKKYLKNSDKNVFIWLPASFCLAKTLKLTSFEKLNPPFPQSLSRCLRFLLFLLLRFFFSIFFYRLPTFMETLEPNPSVAVPSDQTLDSDLLNPYPGFYPIQAKHQSNLDGSSGETTAIEGNESGYDLKGEDYDDVGGSPYRQYPEIDPDHRVLPSNSWSVQEESLEIISTGVGAGLENLGNTCFINAILQCFTHTVPLVQALRSCNHLKPCQGNNGEGFCVLCTLIEHIDLSIASSGKVIAPTKLVENLNYISSVFERYQQEDAHEFLQCLLDRLERCCLESQKVDTSLPSSAGNNLVEQIFGGRLVSKLQCCNCGHCSDTYEPLIDLSLEIEDVDSLQSALESFTKLETIDDSETKFTCEKCKEVVSLEKQLKLDKAPSVAAFHLKRFKTDGSSIVKIDKHVVFPLELDLQPYSSAGENNNVELKYHLYAIVEHTGFSPTYGHYFSYIRSSPETWHRLNDSRVTRVQEDYVLSQDAYILFYAKQGTTWFSSLLGDEKLCMDLSTSNLSPKSVLDNVDNDASSYCGVVKANHFVANESRDFAVGNSAQFSGERSSCGEFHKVKDGVEGAYASQKLGLRQDATDFKESKNNYSMINSSATAQANKNHDGVSYNEKMLHNPSLWEDKCDQGVEKVKSNDGFRPLTPPRSPSPDDFGKPSENNVYQIPIEQKLESQVKCKRKLEQDDGKKLERVEALRCLNKNMTGSRRLKLMAAINDGPMNRKRKINSSLCGRTSPRSARRKHNHSSYARRVTI